MLANKHKITKDYIKLGNARSGKKNLGVKFIVSHDTGNAGTTAYQNRNHFNNNQPNASAHTFIDDQYILEIVPLDEKAWHVLYEKPIDNRMFGDDSNDIAIGVELCFGKNSKNEINFKEAYDRFIWYHAYLCHKFGLDPTRHIVSHKALDPQRKTDPDNALNRYGITWEKFLADVFVCHRDFYKEFKIEKASEKGGRKMNLNSSYTKMLVDAYTVAHEKGIISSTDWIEKAKNGDLTVDEAIFLNTIILARTVLK